MSDDIVRIKPTATFVGSCPTCGAFIWSTDLIHPETENLKAVYKCIKCKESHARENIVPF